MARCCALGKRRGYYRALLSDTEDDLSTEILDAGNILDSEIYEVERLLDKKVVKVSIVVNTVILDQTCFFQKITYYFVLWKNHPKEEACWVESQNITAEAIR